MRRKTKLPSDEALNRLGRDNPRVAIELQRAAGVPWNRIRLPRSVWVKWIKAQGWEVPPQLRDDLDN